MKIKCTDVPTDEFYIRLQIYFHKLHLVLNILGEWFIFSKIPVKNHIMNCRIVPYILHFVSIFQYVELTWLGVIYTEAPALAL